MSGESGMLSKREWEVMVLVSEGRSNQEVADELQIAVHTVEQHLKHIFAKLEVRNRTQASNAFRQLGDGRRNDGNPV